MAESISNIQKAQAAKLKAAGNAFHVEGKYRKAYSKYSEAIKVDSTNAVLYANRAASALSMKEYLDAASDAKKAVDIDPIYTKAWARLGKALQALGSWSQSISAYEKALSLLPGDSHSSLETSLKAQCEAGLACVQETVNRLVTEDNSFVRIPIGEVKTDELPWHRAETMMEALVSTENPNSSAWVIMNAHREFTEGVETMKLTRFIENVGWDPHCNPTALSTMSHGVMRDARAFEMSHPKEWEEMYNRQVSFEHAVRQSWVKEGPRQVKKEAVQRLKSFGWSNVRPALRTTVAGWFMRAFFSVSTKQYVAAIEFYSRTVEILEWGRHIWKDIPLNDRGPIFELTFIRGIKRLYMTALMEAYAIEGDHNPKFKLKKTVELAREIIADARANPPSTDGPPYDPGFILSFWNYPIGEALAVIGFYHMRTAMRTVNHEDEARRHFTEAAKYYLESAETFPQDDEKHSYFLAIALEAYWWHGTPLQVTLPLCERVRQSLAKATHIWEAYLKNGRNVTINQCLEFQDEWTKRVDQGEFSMGHMAKPAALD